jgi:Phospholipase_D-nuclease N-terminal
VLLFLVQIVLAVLALISCLSAEADEIRALPRLAWVLIILFFPLVGSIAWFLAGRPARTEATGSRRRGGGGFAEPKRSRPVAPDDDPDFLNSLDANQSQQDRKLFEQWEEDLKRREDELRRRESGDESAP